MYLRTVRTAARDENSKVAVDGQAKAGLPAEAGVYVDNRVGT
jgi:hypothetical protein